MSLISNSVGMAHIAHNYKFTITAAVPLSALFIDIVCFSVYTKLFDFLDFSRKL